MQTDHLASRGFAVDAGLSIHGRVNAFAIVGFEQSPTSVAGLDSARWLVTRSLRG